MKWTDFLRNYPDEESCKVAWKQYRDRVDVTCPHCGCKEYHWEADKECHECKKCGYGQSLKANTVIHGFRLPFRYRFMSIQMLTSTKKGISAKELQRQPGHKDCNPAWAMLHKLRDVTGKRDSQYELDGTFGFDECFFATGIPEGEKDKPLKRGRGGQRKTPVMAMAETTPETAATRSVSTSPRPSGTSKCLSSTRSRLWTSIRKSRRMSTQCLPSSLMIPPHALVSSPL